MFYLVTRITDEQTSLKILKNDCTVDFCKLYSKRRL